MKSKGIEDNEIIKVLMNRDGMSLEAAVDLLQEARDDFSSNPFNDSEELIEEWFGLEPDYIFDFLEGI